jgi:hypothetical protein
MSLDYSASFGPVTPPDFSFEETLCDGPWTTPYIESDPNDSCWSQDSSLDSMHTELTMPMTPMKSPIRQLGPLLLPKIRSQDQTIEAQPKRVKKTPLARSKTLLPSAPFKPSHSRSYTNPEIIPVVSPIPSHRSHNRSASALCSPISISSTKHQRRTSSSSLDGQVLGKYGFPTYRQAPSYVAAPVPIHCQSLSPPAFLQAPLREPSPMRNEVSIEDLSYLDEMSYTPPPSQSNSLTTTLLSYLTSPNPAPALVHHLTTPSRDPMAKHFWWDIRQIRPWSGFTMAAIKSIPSLLPLLTVPLPLTALPVPSRSASHLENELSLANLYANFYIPKLNAALSVSQGARHLCMRASSSPLTLISNYTDDVSSLIYGRGLGRVVGLVKAFDSWNTGMRVEGNHKKVQYLRGLAQVHGLMREHGCRYGFIITEIELVVLRNGTEATPYFGYLEIQTIQLAEHSSSASTVSEGEAEGEGEENLTALLALYYLHLLAKDEPLEDQAPWKSAIGAPAEGTRRKCMAKDKCIPEPQLVEKRESKRSRGWVWPEEAVGRKELGKRGVRYAGK